MMNEVINIEEVMRNTRKYWYVDGLTEIAGGGLIVGIAAFYYLTSLVENPITRSLLLTFGLPLVILLGGYFIRKIIPWLKERITYPRTGYLSFRKKARSQKTRRFVMLLIIAVMVSAVTAFFTRLLPERYIPLVTSIFFMLYTCYLGYQAAVRRFYLIAVISLLVGVLVTWLNPSGILPFVYLLGGVGLTWVAGGAAALFQYLQKTELLKEET
jgi:MFS family permease